MPKATKEEESAKLLEKLNKLFGPGTMIAAGNENELYEEREWVSSGSRSLDEATGVSGTFPKGGKTTCVVGENSTGKSTMCYSAIADEQSKGNLACLLDIENSYDQKYAMSLGVIPSRLHLVNRKALLKFLKVSKRDVVSLEEWMNLLVEVLKSDIYGIVVLDSLPALIPMVEIEGGVETGKMASVASPLTKAYRAISAALPSFGGAFVYINQWRMSPGKYGDPRVEHGAGAFQYLQDMRLEISRELEKDEDTKEVSGIYVKGKVAKSKVCIPFKTFKYYIEFGKGIIPEYEYIQEAIDKSVVTVEGKTWYMNGEKVAIGKANFEQMVYNNPDLFETLKRLLNEKTTKEPEGELPQEGTEEAGEDSEPRDTTPVGV